MKKAEVQIGETYAVKVSGRIVLVRLDRESPFGGYDGTNLKTGRRVHVKTAARLRYPWRLRVRAAAALKALKRARERQG